MKRKILCIAAALMLLFCALSSALAVEKLATPTNLRWDGNTARWDAVPNAVEYTVYLRGTYSDSWVSTTITTTEPQADCSKTFKTFFDMVTVPNGTIDVTFTVRADSKNLSLYANSSTSEASPALAVPLPERYSLNKPTNLHWDGCTAVWDEVPYAVKYNIVIRVTAGTSYSTTSLSSTVPSIDCEKTIKSLSDNVGLGEGTVYVTFTVKALTNDLEQYTNSPTSPKSPELAYERPKKILLQTPTNLRWNGTTGEWDGDPNTSKYMIVLTGHFGSTTTWTTLYSTETSINFLDAMKKTAYEQGVLDKDVEFSFYLYAQTDDPEHYVSSLPTKGSPHLPINLSQLGKKPGDINKNGSINGADAVTLLSFIADGAADTVQAIADVDDNGRVDANDALRIMQYAAGWNVTLK